MSWRCSILRFRRLMSGLTIARSEQWLRRADTRKFEGGIMRGSIDFAESEIDDRDYDRWLDTITEASARLDALQCSRNRRALPVRKRGCLHRPDPQSARSAGRIARCGCGLVADQARQLPFSPSLSAVGRDPLPSSDCLVGKKAGAHEAWLQRNSFQQLRASNYAVPPWSSGRVSKNLRAAALVRLGWQRCVASNPLACPTTTGVRARACSGPAYSTGRFGARHICVT